MCAKWTAESELQQAALGDQQQPDTGRCIDQEKSNSLGILIAPFHLVIALQLTYQNRMAPIGRFISHNRHMV